MGRNSRWVAIRTRCRSASRWAIGTNGCTSPREPTTMMTRDSGGTTGGSAGAAGAVASALAWAASQEWMCSVGLAEWSNSIWTCPPAPAETTLTPRSAAARSCRLWSRRRRNAVATASRNRGLLTSLTSDPARRVGSGPPFDGDVQQERTAGAQSLLERGTQLARFRHSRPLDAQAARQIDEAQVRRDQVHVRVAAVGLGAEPLPVRVHVVLQDPVLAVVQDHEHHRELVMRRRPERLDGVHRRAVAGQRDHRAIRAGQLHSQRSGQGLADAAPTRADVVAGALELDRAREIDAGGDGLVHHDRIGRQRGLDLGHEAWHRDRCSVPPLGGPRALGLHVLRLELAQGLVPPDRPIAERGAATLAD